MTARRVSSVRPARWTLAPFRAKPIFAEVHDHSLTLTGSEVLDGRLIALDYRLEPAAA